MNLYCGNNANHPSLINGNKQVGNPKDCLNKGISVGFNMPYDKNYIVEYIPIDDTKVYCGNDENLPYEYDEFGSLKECFTRGIGIGKANKARFGYKNHIFYNYIVPFLLFSLFFLTISGVLYYNKPSFITYNDPNNTQNYKKIDWSKFSLYLILLAIILGGFVYFLWKTKLYF